MDEADELSNVRFLPTSNLPFGTFSLEIDMLIGTFFFFFTIEFPPLTTFTVVFLINLWKLCNIVAISTKVTLTC